MTDQSRFLTGQLHMSGAGGGDISGRRIELLEAIQQTGSISAAARRLSMSYRSAWDAIDEMNNMWDVPLVTKSAGGSQGGGTRLTEHGLEVIDSFKLMQQEYRRFLDSMSRNLGDLDRLQQVIRRFSMRSSARNQFQGRVDTINPGPINSEVSIAINEREHLTAVITTESVEQLGLTLGREVYALIKASFIILVPANERCVTSARNRLCGTVRELRHGTVSCEAIVELDGGKTLAVIITEDSANAEAFQPGKPVCALIKASHVILGVN